MAYSGTRAFNLQIEEIIEEAFERFTSERKDIGILLINQHVRNSFVDW